MCEVETNTTEILNERWELALGRVREISSEKQVGEEVQTYFAKVAEFLLMLADTVDFIQHEGLQKAPVEELAKRNHALYEDVLPENYENSFGNPAYAVKQLGTDYGNCLSYLYVRMRNQIAAVYEGRMEDLVTAMELFIEVYGAFSYAHAEHTKPSAQEIKDIIYWGVIDAIEAAEEYSIRTSVCTNHCFHRSILENSDLTSPRFLYAYGYYVTYNELETLEHLNHLPAETLQKMADTYTEGYRIGFETSGKDLSIKSTVQIRYRLGFEPMMKLALANFRKMGLEASVNRLEVVGGTVNRQYTYDHKDDAALFFDKNYVNRCLEARKNAYETYRKEAKGVAGPAVLETFGEAQFNPVNKPEKLKMSDEQNKLYVEYLTKSGLLRREYIIQEERSFTIIAFPIPEVGEVYQELFDETIRINTLDYIAYRDVQQKLIDALDTADYCVIKGCGDNRTDLKVNLWKLADPSKESIFENCVADVNIPVGEVFTSPVLEGTNGTLHVSKVYLNGLEYRDLQVVLEDGMVKDYTCSNFDTEEESKSFINENVMFRHKTLPLGEFAIGTNTTAYVVARRLNVEAKLPILIAEKTGPHFALGDTCYPHSEEIRVFNPDGKEIVAKENSRSRLRNEDPTAAYFDCHTDITIPYDELGELTAVRKDGTRVEIIRNGRFVLAGTEFLNEPFNE